MHGYKFVSIYYVYYSPAIITSIFGIFVHTPPTLREMSKTDAKGFMFSVGGYTGEGTKDNPSNFYGPKGGQ
jgi:hypothetical protein